MARKKVSVIIPCYNSESHLKGTLDRIKLLKTEIEQLGYEVESVMVNDGSKDATLKMLLDFKSWSPEHIKVVDLSGNFGSYSAFLAGCHYATGDCCIHLHDDLQDPPEHIPAMLEHWRKGFKLVIAQRIQREEPLFHKTISITYHWLMRNFALPHVPSGGYDLILFDKELRDHIVRMNETNTNLVYLISWLKYPYLSIPITRKVLKSPSRWNFMKRTKLVIDSFVSFSYSPVRLVTLFALFSILVFVCFTIALLFKPALLFLYWFISFWAMLILIGLSVVAEYLYRTLIAALKRPPFIVNEIY